MRGRNLPRPVAITPLPRLAARGPALLLLALLPACASSGVPRRAPVGRVAPVPAPRGAPTRIVMEPIKLQAVDGPRGPTVDVLDASTLFEQGGQLLSRRRYRDALRRYDEMLRSFSGSRFVSPALYNAGLAHEWLGEFQRAAQRYQELIRRFGSTKEAIDASFRLGGCFAELRNWPASAAVFGELLQRQDLSASDRIECLTRKGLAHFRLGDHRACRATLQQAIDFHKSIDTAERLDTDFFLAMASYYQAAIPHQEFRQLKVDAGEGLARTLDEKARLLLFSQAGYIRAINVRNPYWATAAGFQIGSLYREFYTLLLTTMPDFTAQAARNAALARIPPSAAREQLTQVYLEEVHRTVKPLLNKAIRVFEKNVFMADRVGVKTDWVVKSRHQIDELKHLLSLPPRDAVKLVTRDGPLPEDQAPPPASEERTGPGSRPAEERKGGPDLAPARPGDRPAEDEGDEPGRVIL